MGHLDLVQLTALMDRTSGRAEVSVGLIDGPVLLTHPDLASEHIREVSGKLRGICARSDSIACVHGTFVAGILSARRGSTAPAICPVCSLLLRPIFSEAAGRDNGVPSASPQDLAEAIIDTVDAGARIINLSSALAQPSAKGENKLEEALNYASPSRCYHCGSGGQSGDSGKFRYHPPSLGVALFRSLYLKNWKEIKHEHTTIKCRGVALQKHLSLSNGSHIQGRRISSASRSHPCSDSKLVSETQSGLL
jgi:hypothetical protein